MSMSQHVYYRQQQSELPQRLDYFAYVADTDCEPTDIMKQKVL